VYLTQNWVKTTQHFFFECGGHELYLFLVIKAPSLTLLPQAMQHDKNNSLIQS